MKEITLDEEFNVSAQARARDPSLPKTYRARVVRYEKKAHRPSTLVTSMTDHKAFPSSELVALAKRSPNLCCRYEEPRGCIQGRLKSK